MNFTIAEGTGFFFFLLCGPPGWLDILCSFNKTHFRCSVLLYTHNEVLEKKWMPVLLFQNWITRMCHWYNFSLHWYEIRLGVSITKSTISRLHFINFFACDLTVKFQTLLLKLLFFCRIFIFYYKHYSSIRNTFKTK